MCHDRRLMPGPCNFEQANVCWELTLALTGRNKLQLMVEKNIRIYTATNSEHRACNMGTSCERAVSSAVSYLHVLPSVRLTLCWCSPNHFSSVRHGAQSSIIIIILNHPRRQNHNMSFNLTFGVNRVKLNVCGPKLSVSRTKDHESSCSQSATLVNINRWLKDEFAGRTFIFEAGKQ